MHDLLTLPKVNLHVHLENAVRPATLRELAARHEIVLPAGLGGNRWAVADFADFFVQNGAARARVLSTPRTFGAWPTSSARTRRRRAFGMQR
jgi:hypothetical protein